MAGAEGLSGAGSRGRLGAAGAGCPLPEFAGARVRSDPRLVAAGLMPMSAASGVTGDGKSRALAGGSSSTTIELLRPELAGSGETGGG